MSVENRGGAWVVLDNETKKVLGSFASRGQARENNAKLQGSQPSAPATPKAETPVKALSTAKIAPTAVVEEEQSTPEVMVSSSVILNATVIVIPENASQDSIVDAFKKVAPAVALCECPVASAEPVTYNEQDETPVTTGKTLQNMKGGGGARVKIRRNGQEWDIFRNDGYLGTAPKEEARKIMHYLTDNKTAKIPSQFKFRMR